MECECAGAGGRGKQGRMRAGVTLRAGANLRQEVLGKLRGDDAGADDAPAQLRGGHGHAGACSVMEGSTTSNRSFGREPNLTVGCHVLGVQALHEQHPFHKSDTEEAPIHALFWSDRSCT